MPSLTKQEIVDQCKAILVALRGRLINYSERHYGSPSFDHDTYSYCLEQQFGLFQVVASHEDYPLSKGALGDIHEDCIALLREVDTLTRPCVKSANKT